MTDVFNPKTHLLVAVDPETKEHFHVTLAELAFDALEIPLPSMPDVGRLLARMDLLEQIVAASVTPAQAPPEPVAAPVDLNPVMEAIGIIAGEQRVETANTNDRITAIEQRLEALLSVVEAGLAKVGP